jgi:hypothetical protein
VLVKLPSGDEVAWWCAGYRDFFSNMWREWKHRCRGGGGGSKRSVMPQTREHLANLEFVAGNAWSDRDHQN